MSRRSTALSNRNSPARSRGNDTFVVGLGELLPGSDSIGSLFLQRSSSLSRLCISWRLMFFSGAKDHSLAWKQRVDAVTHSSHAACWWGRLERIVVSGRQQKWRV
eukprot:1825482-Ditylum_brightwellii.AAC.1